MSLSRFLLWIVLTISTVFACQRFRDPASATISARELLTRTQRVSGANYTFDRGTSAAMETAQVPEPSATADQQALEIALSEAGFVLRPLDVPGKKVFLVEKTGS